MTLDKLLYPSDLYQGKPRIQKLEGGAQDFVFGGADIEFRTKKGGDLDGFMVHALVNYDVANADLVFLPRAPWSIFSRVKFKPQGRLQFIDSVSSYSLAVHDWHTKGLSPFVYGARDLRPSGLQASAGVNALIEAFPKAVGAENVADLWFYVSARRSATDSRGRIPLSNDQELRLVLTPNTKANLVTTAANFVDPDLLQVTVWQVTYDDAPQGVNIAAVDRNWCVLIEEKEVVAQVGRNEIPLLPDGSLILGVGVTCALNATQATSGIIDSLDLRVDKAYIWEPQTDPLAFYFWNKRTYGTPCIDGIFYFDFDAMADTDGPLWKSFPPADPAFASSKVQPSLGRMLNTASAVGKEIIVGFDIPSGTVLGATPRFYVTTRKLVQVG